MARDRDSVVAEAMARLRLTEASGANTTIQTMVQGWLNDVIEDIHGRYDWYWTLDRQLLQTVAAKTDGTVSVAASGQTATGTGTAFAAADVGKFIRFSGSNDWYKITAVASATSLTIEAPYTQTSALTDGTYEIRQVFYSVSSAEKIISAKQAITSREVICIDHKDFDTFLTFGDSTGKGRLFCVYGQDSSGNIQVNIWPNADEIYNIELKVKLKATEDSLSKVPEKWRHVYLDGVLVRGLEYIAIGQPEFKSAAIDSKKADYERGIAKMLADAEPDSSAHAPVLMNRDVAVGTRAPRLPDGLSIPLD